MANLEKNPKDRDQQRIENANGDPFKIFGLSRQEPIDADELKQIYRRLIIKLHPDKYKGDERDANKLFNQVNEAHTKLKDLAAQKVFQQPPATPVKPTTPHTAETMREKNPDQGAAPASGKNAAARPAEPTKMPEPTRQQKAAQIAERERVRIAAEQIRLSEQAQSAAAKRTQELANARAERERAARIEAAEAAAQARHFMRNPTNVTPRERPRHETAAQAPLVKLEIGLWSTITRLLGNFFAMFSAPRVPADKDDIKIKVVGEEDFTNLNLKGNRRAPAQAKQPMSDDPDYVRINIQSAKKVTFGPSTVYPNTRAARRKRESPKPTRD